MSKVGVVLCRCNSLIDTCIDFNFLLGKLEKNKRVHSVIQLNMVCSPQGKSEIEDYINKEGINKLVVAACSPLFKGKIIKSFADNLNIPRQKVEVINVREQCAWVHESEIATKKALTLIRMGIQKVYKTKNVGNWDFNCAYIDLNKCDKCKRCIEECPRGAISLREDGYPRVNADLCQKCGICVGGCPLAAISLPDYRLEEISAMIKPVTKSSFPSILGFFCDFTYEEADLMGQIGASYPSNIFIIKVPCSGAINMTLVNDAIAEGVDGVVIAGCKCSQCKYKKGNELAKDRIENFQQNLEDQLLEKERLVYLSLGEDIAQSAWIDDKKCSRCGLCYNVCPFGAIDITEDGRYEVNSRACRGCGTCAGACSVGAIVLSGFEDEKLMGEVDFLVKQR